MNIVSDRHLIDSMQSMDFTGELKNINTPTLVLSGGGAPPLNTNLGFYPMLTCRCSLGPGMRSAFMKPKESQTLFTSLCSMGC